MHVISLGSVKVLTPGTPVLLGSVLTALDFSADILQQRKCHRIEMWPLLANTGAVYAGLSATARAAGGVVMNATTGKNVIKQVQTPAAAGHQDFVELHAGPGNAVLVDDYAVDAAVANNGFDIFLSVQ
jgi:hypothetical protein